MRDKIKALKLDGKTVELIDLPDPNEPNDALKKEVERIIGGRNIAVKISEDALIIAAEHGETAGYSQNPLASLVMRQQVFGTALIIGAKKIEEETGDTWVDDVPNDIVNALMGDG